MNCKKLFNYFLFIQLSNAAKIERNQKFWIKDSTAALFREQNCPKLFTAQLIYQKQLVEFEYEKNGGVGNHIQYSSCHFRDKNGKGTLSYHFEDQKFSGNFYIDKYLKFTQKGQKGKIRFKELRSTRSIQCSSLHPTPEMINDVKQSRSKRDLDNVINKRVKAADKKFIELIFVINEDLMNQYSQREAIERYTEVYNIMNDHYVRAGIHLLLLDIIFWENDPTESNLSHQNSDENLREFSNWIKKTEGRKYDRVDNVLLFLGEEYFEDPVVGKAFVGTLCTKMAAGIIGMNSLLLTVLIYRSRNALMCPIQHWLIFLLVKDFIS